MLALMSGRTEGAAGRALFGLQIRASLLVRQQDVDNLATFETQTWNSEKDFRSKILDFKRFEEAFGSRFESLKRLKIACFIL